MSESSRHGPLTRMRMCTAGEEARASPRGGRPQVTVRGMSISRGGSPGHAASASIMTTAPVASAERALRRRAIKAAWFITVEKYRPPWADDEKCAAGHIAGGIQVLPISLRASVNFRVRRVAATLCTRRIWAPLSAQAATTAWVPVSTAG